MRERETTRDDAPTLALNALVWILGDDIRAGRLLSLTGLDGDAIRARIGDPALLVAVLDFLSQHEPDLIACAAAIGVKPTDLISARERMSR
jgi:hypothetical protein